MKITIAQINPTVGDVRGNLEKHKDAVAKAEASGSDVVIFPELSLCGYPPKDLLLHPDFVSAVLDAETEVAKMSGKVAIIYGSVKRTLWPGSKPLQNMAVVADGGKVLARVAKRLLPTYDVFDEARYFEPGRAPILVPLRGEVLGISVCEDIWNDKEFWADRLYDLDPVQELVNAGATMLVNISASPFSIGKPGLREKMIGHAAKKYGRVVVYANQVGGNDDVIYDGRSMVFNPNGVAIRTADAFKEELLTIDVLADGSEYVGSLPLKKEIDVIPSDAEIAEVYEALVLGTRDYVRKCGFKSIVLGLSGGVDSAVVAAIATEALGNLNVLGLMMPSEFSSEGSVSDAMKLGNALDISYRVVPIKAMHKAALGSFGIPIESWVSVDDKTYAETERHKVELWEENAQARIRGMILMAYSNKYGHMLLTTGNKSEVAVGYCTLYGDTCGGLAVISDVFKTRVFELARYINKIKGKEIIPEATITKAPSAELRPGQFDQESLPPYDQLDAVLRPYIEDEMSLSRIVEETGQSREFVQKIISRVDNNEYKRKQLAPGLRITKHAFGSGRILPIAQAWRPQP
jgi:NAD+ synthetase